MSERLRKAYEIKEQQRIERLVKLKNRDFHDKMHQAGTLFRDRHGTKKPKSVRKLFSRMLNEDKLDEAKYDELIETLDKLER